MSDIVERLRRRIDQADVMEKYLMIEAADEIERLGNEVLAFQIEALRLHQEIERLQASWELHAKAAFDFEVKCETIRATTIEECAEFAWDFCFKNGAPGIADALEEAIRALKEKS